MCGDDAIQLPQSDESLPFKLSRLYDTQLDGTKGMEVLVQPRATIWHVVIGLTSAGLQMKLHPAALEECLADTESKELLAAIAIKGLKRLVGTIPAEATLEVCWDVQPFQRLSSEQLHVERLRQARRQAPKPSIATMTADPVQLLEQVQSLRTEPDAGSSHQLDAPNLLARDVSPVVLVEVVPSDHAAIDTPQYIMETKGDVLLVTVTLPEVGSVAEIDLDVTATHLYLEVINSYRLHLELSHEVLPGAIKAKFVKKSSCLKLKLNIVV
jgi:hypothetical protein